MTERISLDGAAHAAVGTVWQSIVASEHKPVIVTARRTGSTLKLTARLIGTIEQAYKHVIKLEVFDVTNVSSIAYTFRANSCRKEERDYESLHLPSDLERFYEDDGSLDIFVTISLL